jgi:hypothetical protein
MLKNFLIIGALLCLPLPRIAILIADQLPAAMKAKMARHIAI